MNKQLPESSYIETVLSSLENHSHGALLLILFAAVVVFGIWSWTRK